MAGSDGFCLGGGECPVVSAVLCRQLPVRMGALLLVPDAVARAEVLRSNVGQTVDMPSWKASRTLWQQLFAQAMPLSHNMQLWTAAFQCCIMRLRVHYALLLLARQHWQGALSHAVPRQCFCRGVFCPAWRDCGPGAPSFLIVCRRCHHRSALRVLSSQSNQRWVLHQPGTSGSGLQHPRLQQH